MSAKNKSTALSHDLSSGKLRRVKRDTTILNPYDGPPDELIRPAHCPYNTEDPDVVNSLQKPFKTAKLNCALEIELELAAEFHKHTHSIIIDVDKSKFPQGTDFSSWEYDPGEILCGLFFKISQKVKAVVGKSKFADDRKTQNLLEQATEEACSISEDLRETMNEKERSALRLENYTKQLYRLEAYLQKHLKDELERVSERLVFEAHIADERGEKRAESIRIFLEQEESALRRRLRTPKGRVPVKERSDFFIVKRDFLEHSFTILQELESEGARLNKSQLAKKMFRSDNPLLLLNRKLKDFNLTFEEIMQQYSEQKST